MARRPLALIDPENVFENVFNTTPATSFAGFQPTETELDMYEDDNNVVVEVKAPGFDESNVDINVEDNVLTVTGSKQYEETNEDDENRRYYYKEMRDESFTRSVSLPVQVKPQEANAQ
ncbi:MAG: Hsp20/alpha crystallin family protein, partial [Candidatus Paceibacteria bacterium]